MSKYRVRQSELTPYAPANHTGTRNFRLIGPEPVGGRPPAPAPRGGASGSAPRTIAPVVIRIGRRRRVAASATAAAASRPLARSWLANSTINMPCLVIRPISITRPICE